jgi:hypothetical protein
MLTNKSLSLIQVQVQQRQHPSNIMKDTEKLLKLNNRNPYTYRFESIRGKTGMELKLSNIYP